MLYDQGMNCCRSDLVVNEGVSTNGKRVDEEGVFLLPSKNLSCLYVGYAPTSGGGWVNARTNPRKKHPENKMKLKPRSEVFGSMARGCRFRRNCPSKTMHTSQNCAAKGNGLGLQ